MNERSAPLKVAVERLGGEVRSSIWEMGVLTVDLPPEAVDSLGQRHDLRSIQWAERGAIDDNCNGLCDPDEPPFTWYLGSGRQADRLDADRFLAAGYDGEESNQTFHPLYTDIMIGIVESTKVLDEACFLTEGYLATDSWNNCSSSNRLKKKFECISTGCTSVASWSAEGDHATRVASMALGDYMDGQAACESIDDVCYDPPTYPQSCNQGGDHCDWWKISATGMAPEAGAIAYAMANGSCDACRLHAINSAITYRPDILNFSWRENGGGLDECDITSSRPIEDAVEIAFDEGIFIVSSAGNSNGPFSVSCNVGAPADTPKAFAVNSFTASQSECLGDYTKCEIDDGNAETPGSGGSAHGGGDAVFGTQVVANTLSMVDLAAPGLVRQVTQTGGPYGEILSGAFGGTSAAVPHVAGLAALVKDWMVATGRTWINSPGRLHTLMLAMGDMGGYTTGTVGCILDANCGATKVCRGELCYDKCIKDSDCTGSQVCTGDACRTHIHRNQWMDDLFGAGRVKLRLLDPNHGFDPVKWRMLTYTLGNGSTTDPPPYMMSTTPMLTGTDFAKCVLFHAEDMSTKSNVSDITLEARIKLPVGGSCSTTGGSVLLNRSDTSWDLKHAVSFDSSELALAGKCLEFQLKRWIPTVSSISLSVFCYSYGVIDNETTN